MVKPLNEMSLEELGRLFPIILSEYNPDWPAIYASEKELIEHAVGKDHIKRISHYGSTSIPGIIAKPTIDILLEVSDDCDNEELIRNLVDIGYLYNPQPRDPPPHMMLMKGYTPEGFVGQTYHIHVRYGGDWDELYFRDYLILHPDVAEEYSKLKRRLKEEYQFDREAYTQGKAAFIQSVVKEARNEPGRIE
ncbi:GrpB family protein [Methanoculleus methanifontis]|nr:GrpB family protein [Methanoculleus sp. FWC-SCC3]